MESGPNPMQAISILIVEDEAVTLEFLLTTLASKYPGSKLYKALNGKTGLDLFRTHTPEIVITDLNMPEMGGAQMTEEIRAIKPDTKFIVLTGDTEKLTLEVSAGNGVKFDHSLKKPIFFVDLFAAIEECVGEISWKR